MNTQTEVKKKDMFDGLYYVLNLPVKQWQHLFGISLVLFLCAGPFAMAGGFSGGGSSDVTAPVVITGSSDVTQLKIVDNATQTTVPFQIFQSDGSTNVLSVSNAGAGVFAGQVTANGNGFILGAGTLRNSSGTLYFDPLGSKWRIGATGIIEDGNANVMVSFIDDGTTGYLTSTSTKQTGTISLSTGTGTATVRSAAICVCTDTTANASVRCAVSTTTLTATGTGSDVIAYWCN